MFRQSSTFWFDPDDEFLTTIDGRIYYCEVFYG